MKILSIGGWINHPEVQRTVEKVLPYRFTINMVIHGILFTLSYGYSILLLNGMVLDETSVSIFGATIVPLLAVRLLSFYLHDLFQGLWRYVSFEDLINIIRAAVISSMLFYVAGLVWDRICVSEELYVLDLTFCVLMTGGVRSLVRNLRERYFRGRRTSAQKKVLVVGPLDKIQPILKEFVSDPNSHYLPLAVVDPLKDENANLTRLCDVPVMSTMQLLAGKPNFRKVDAVIFCWPGSSRRQVNELVELLKPLSVPFKIIPHLQDILDSRVSISDIREVEIEDLLERPPVQIEMEKISAYLQDKTIMVTGGGGSIGSEICRQVAGFSPRRIVVVERSENSLYDLILEFKRVFPKTPFTACVSSVNDAQGLRSMMETHNVDVVFHAAAYKHVPMMEPAPVESAYNNIEGTYNAAMAAIEAGVQRFVMISTDKAVNPTNVMGVTKRIAEMIVQSSSNNKTRFMTVRFGNVLGSAGSVIPIFKKQMALGGPLTVTHPDIERYFMTIPEAVQLVLQAGCMGKGGEIFVLDMGEPVKILRLAENLVTLSGKKPYEDIDIVFTGLRPGEKMYEELFNDSEKLSLTSHPRIQAAVSMEVGKEYMQAQIGEIRALIRARDHGALLKKFHAIVPGYHHPRPVNPGSKVRRFQNSRSNVKQAVFGAEPVTTK